ncbi:hypothetical protein G4O51_11180 [Candidatus Bathyarchaeota archaeon A05DMB-2]|nr:hypothetical protein [Candidatus Bathyarchaeota archaeon A05DMB-2]
MAKGKAKSGRLSVFKGKEARLNRAIFQLLALKEPLATCDVFKEFRKRKDMAHIRYSVLIRRVKALQESDYIMKVGERKTKLGSETALYQLTPRAELAIVLDQTNLDKFIRKANYHRIISALDAFQHLEQ